jgi:hypothetical protein
MDFLLAETRGITSPQFFLETHLGATEGYNNFQHETSKIPN